MKDQAGMRAVVAATAALAEDPEPAEGFHRGEYHRMRVGLYRVVYVIDPDRITIERVDRAGAAETDPA
jgi:mRNA-degrading endonuclease RelE of RelBE toxin-antitoxin system